jgi:hypothetical protein
MATDLARVTAPDPPPGVPALVFLSAVVAERRRRETARLSGPQQPGYGGPPPYPAPPYPSPPYGAAPYGVAQPTPAARPAPPSKPPPDNPPPAAPPDDPGDNPFAPPG